MLEQHEKWLLNIPLVFVTYPSVNGFCYHRFDPRECAIALCAGVFGRLFSANERVKIIKESLQQDGESSITPSAFANSLEAFLLGSDLGSQWHFLPRTQARDPQHIHQIWRITVIQQVFLLLHEFGHLWVEPEQSDKPKEFEADRWAAKHIVDGIPGVSVVDPLLLDDAIFRLFAFFEILRRRGKYAPGQAHPRPDERWLNVAPLLAPQSCGAPGSVTYNFYAELTKNVFEDVESFFFRTH